MSGRKNRRSMAKTKTFIRAKVYTAVAKAFPCHQNVEEFAGRDWKDLNASQKQARIADATVEHNKFKDEFAAGEAAGKFKTRNECKKATGLEFSYAALAKKHNCCRGALFRTLTGDGGKVQAISRVGVGGGPIAGIPDGFEVVLIAAMDEANGNGTKSYSVGSIKELARQLYNEGGYEANCRFSDSWSRGISKKFKEKTGRKVKSVEPQTKSKEKTKAADPRVVASWLKMIQELLKSIDLPGLRKGSAVIYSSHVCTWDEVGFIVTKDGKLRQAMYVNGKPTNVDKNNVQYHLTVLVGTCLDGTALPPLLVYDGKLWKATDNKRRLKGLPEGWSVTTSETGSMCKTKNYGTEGELCQGIEGTGEGCELGTMVDWANHNVQAVRPLLGISNDEQIIHIIDGATCHLDDVALEILRCDNQKVLAGPSESTHFLQVNDAKEINGTLQRLKRNVLGECQNAGMPVAKNNIAQVILSVYYYALSPANIFAAAKRVGFTYLKGKELGEEHMFITVTDEDIDHAIQLHQELYKLNEQYQSWAQQVSGGFLRKALRNRRELKMVQVNKTLGEHGIEPFMLGVSEEQIKLIQDIRGANKESEYPDYVPRPTLASLRMTRDDFQAFRRGARLLNSKTEIARLAAARKKKDQDAKDKATRKADRKEKAEAAAAAKKVKAAAKAAESRRMSELKAWLDEQGWALKGEGCGPGGPITLKSLSPFLKKGKESLAWAKDLIRRVRKKSAKKRAGIAISGGDGKRRCLSVMPSSSSA